MSISTSASRIVVAGNGVTTAFVYNFLITGTSSTDQTNAQVVYEDASGNLTTLNPATWSITGVNLAAGGTVIYNPSGTPISTGTFLAISRIVPYTQPTVLGGQGAYDPTVVENMVDNVVLQIQQVNTLVGLKIGVPITDNALNDLPTAVNRVSKLVGFDSSGNQPDVTTGGGGGGSTSPGGISGDIQYNNSGAFGGRTLTATLDTIASTQGDILYRNSSAWVALAPGTNGQFLQTQGAAANPQWAAAAGSGTVTSVAAGTGMSFSTITTTGTVAIDTTVVARLAVANAFTVAQGGPVGSLSISASLAAWTANTKQIATLSLNSNATLSNPSGLVAGQTYICIVTQSGGSHTLAFGTVYKWPGGIAPTITATNGAVDVLTFVTDGTNMYGAYQQAFA